MLALGNELDTDNAKKRANATALVNYCRELDDTRLYAEGSNNNYWNVSFNQDDDYWTTCKTVSGRDDKHIRISFSWADARSGGHIESTQPGTDFTYDKALAGYTKPIMNHEAGQYQVLPNFETEIPKYEPGIFEARNLMMYRDRMEKNGILHMNEKFSKASARLSAIGYRADMQTALLSNDLAGYQLLSIQDFPGQGTAHVGILDNFMDEKQGGYTKEQYKNFNDAAVVLGVLPKLVYTNDEILTGKIAIPNYTPENLGDLVGTWKLKDDEKILDEGKLDAVTAKQGEVTYLGEFSTNALGKVEKASHLTVEVAVSGALDNTNSYDIWVYPKKMDVTDAQNVVVSANWDEETQQALKDGKKVLLLPSPTKEVLPGSASVRWTTDYWSRMFHGNDGTVDYRAYTMGTYIEKEHPIFKNFPTEEYSDYQWFNLAKGSRALNLTNVPVDPLVWNIDHMEWGRKLGSLLEVNVESGKLVLCTFDLLGQMDQYPEAKQLYYSILEYMKSDEFIPKHTLSVKELSELVLEEKNGFDAYERIEAEEYMDSNSTGFKEEHGKSEDGNSETAVGGIRGSDWLAYRDVQFGEKGTTSITVNGANDSAYGNEKLELRLDSKDGPVVATLEFKKMEAGQHINPRHLRFHEFKVFMMFI